MSKSLGTAISSPHYPKFDPKGGVRGFFSKFCDTKEIVDKSKKKIFQIFQNFDIFLTFFQNFDQTNGKYIKIEKKFFQIFQKFSGKFLNFFFEFRFSNLHVL